MRAVVLAAGEGKRMRPLTARRPKVMLPVAGRPLLAWLLERAVQAGVFEFVVVTHYQEAAIRDWVRKNPIPRAKVSFVHQKRPAGTGDALAAAGKKAGKDFLFLYGDTLPSVDGLRRLVRSDRPAIGAFKVDDARPYGALVVAGSRLKKIAEKSPRPPSKWINAGAYRLDSEFLRLAAALKKSPRGEFEFTDAVNAFVSGGEPMGVVRFSEWQEAGRPWDLLGLQESLMQGLQRRIEGDVEKGAVLNGPIVVGKGTRIKAGTYIEGPVVIGRDCKIGPNAYLRPSTSIGDGCHVGASVEIKNSILMERSNVPHLSYVGDSVIGSDVNLGAGTSVANLKVTPSNVRATLQDGSTIDTGRRKLGAIVGDGTKIGINCSLNPGTIVGADCVIGLGRSLAGWIPSGARLV
jgi:bifunctional UDP-N-acetylglucosamine pyrophosphorylase/glucosamine-1-phosphate N-acetyltransferase